MLKDFEAVLRCVYEAALRKGDVTIDVGAHIGTHTLPMAQVVGTEGKVYAVEPLPMCRERLAQRILDEIPAFKHVVDIFDFALGAEERDTEYVVAIDALAYSGLKERVYDGPMTLQKIPIHVRRIDEAFEKIARLDYIKVDAEGGEYHIFVGADKTLDRFRPLVTFEFGANSIGEYNITTRDMGDFWFARDYVIYDINGRRMETVDMFAESGIVQDVWDYVAVPKENPDLEERLAAVMKSL